MRVKFYLLKYDDFAWVEMPCRMNEGDLVWVEDITIKDGVDQFKKSTLKDMEYTEKPLLTVEFVTFDVDKQGVYQIASLKHR